MMTMNDDDDKRWTQSSLECYTSIHYNLVPFVK